jgi:hypothetical protein
MPKAALYTAGTVFAVVSALHWVRYVLGSEVTIAGTAFPVFGSLIGGIAAAVLAAWMIFAGRKA